MIVVDGRGSQLSVYDRNGSYLTSFGRRGAGPGEFQRIQAAGLLGDTIWVSDNDLRRVTLFDQRGAVLRTIRLDLDVSTYGFQSAYAAAMLTDGTMLVLPNLIPPPTSDGEWPARPIIQVDRSGEVLRTIGTLTQGRPFLLIGSGTTLAYQPLYDGSLWRASPDGSAITIVDRTVRVGEDPAYSVRRLTPEGPRVFDRRIPYTAVPVTKTVLDSLVDEGIRRLSQNVRVTPQLSAGVRSGLYAPPHFPPITAIVTGRDGKTWLQRELAGGAVPRWLILDQRGSAEAEVTFPNGFRLIQVDGRFAWGVESDEYDVLTVVRYRILPTQ